MRSLKIKVKHAEEALNLCKRKENNRVVLSEDLRLILESA